MGIGLVLMNSLVPKALEWGLEEGEFSWVLESNRLSYGALKKGGAKITKTYRLYDLDEPVGEGEGRGERGEGRKEGWALQCPVGRFRFKVQGSRFKGEGEGEGEGEEEGRGERRRAEGGRRRSKPGIPNPQSTNLPSSPLPFSPLARAARARRLNFPPPLKSARCVARPISIGSSSCPGGFTPKTRTGRRRC